MCLPYFSGTNDSCPQRNLQAKKISGYLNNPAHLCRKILLLSSNHFSYSIITVQTETYLDSVIDSMLLICGDISLKFEAVAIWANIPQIRRASCRKPFSFVSFCNVLTSSSIPIGFDKIHTTLFSVVVKYGKGL